MTKEILDAAKAEAERFLKRCKAVTFKEYTYSNGSKRQFVDDSKASAAVRRASMDLTRALADLRRPGP
jgi:hypothetical protein